jgi:hypothetical protein
MYGPQMYSAPVPSFQHYRTKQEYPLWRVTTPTLLLAGVLRSAPALPSRAHACAPHCRTPPKTSPCGPYGLGSTTRQSRALPKAHRITAHAAAGDMDVLASAEDVRLQHARMPRVSKLVMLPNVSHMDFVWSLPLAPFVAQLAIDALSAATWVPAYGPALGSFPGYGGGYASGVSFGGSAGSA